MSPSTRMIQIRNVPDALHRKLKAHAALEGRSLSDYLLAELERIAEQPTRKELLARLSTASRGPLRTPAAELVRGERDSR